MRAPPAGPPDITARDLTPEELKRNYSCDNFWNVKEQPLPPMPQMTGFGRYRRAVDASAQWQLEQIHRSLQDMGGLSGLVINHLGDCPPAGLDPDTWREYRAQHSRASSIASSRSSGSGFMMGSASEYLDTNTGTRVYRGFSSSTTSSAASSLRENSVHYRRDSGLSKASMTSPSSDGDVRRGHRSSRSSPYRLPSAPSMSHLTSISEMHEAVPNVLRKIEKPCEFDESGDTENALASDDEDDEDDEFDWADMLEVGGGNTSNLTKRIERISSHGLQNSRPAFIRQRTTSSERQKARPAKKALPDRSRNTKPALRPGLGQRRLQYQKKQTDLPELSIQQTEKLQQAENMRKHPKENDVETGQEQVDNPRPLTPNHSVPNMLQEAINKKDASATPSPVELIEDGATSFRSETSNENLCAGDAHNLDSLVVARQRKRSNTVRRVRLISPSFKYRSTKLQDMVEE